MPKFMSTLVVDAIQWNESKATLERAEKELGVRMGSCTGHESQPDMCRCLRMMRKGEVSVDVNPGDWFVKRPGSEVVVMSDDAFTAAFDPLDEGDGKSSYQRTQEILDAAKSPGFVQFSVDQARPAFNAMGLG